MEYDPGEKRGQGQLADIQGSPPPSSEKVCPDKQKTKQSSRRPAWMSTELLTELEHKNKVWNEGVEAGAALFPGAFNCCTKVSDEIPKGILRRVERFEIQKADGLCHLEAVILYIKGRKFCVSPRIRKVKKWMKKNKHKIPRKKTHGRKQRRTKIIKKKEKKQ
ncbi:PREDICTED: C-C motif chemokine 28 [Pygoscelis adeliae]|uniref:C-C motif chemokine 28 n=1 Tax=Pygoscelis adeliae TaxID=9238 RepID=UPI0004F50114|nr:PREDICTED: C-C motif chemokine 28 [Pygoscelis adeliae]